ncbi:hypothetical protein HDV62DRAFT_366709 [Trichoderma sp. SZMC 28011]
MLTPALPTLLFPLRPSFSFRLLFSSFLLHPKGRRSIEASVGGGVTTNQFATSLRQKVRGAEPTGSPSGLPAKGVLAQRARGLLDSARSPTLTPGCKAGWPGCYQRTQPAGLATVLDAVQRTGRHPTGDEKDTNMCLLQFHIHH